MDSIKREEFENRIINADSGELILITYELIFDAIKEAKRYALENEIDKYEKEMTKLVGLLNELINALNFDVDMSVDLGAIYYFCRNEVLKAVVSVKVSALTDIEEILRPLHEAFSQAVAEVREMFASDNAKIERGIVAGLTYGRDGIEDIAVLDKDGIKV